MSVIFEENFLALPTKHQEVWKALHFFCRKFKHAFPCYKRLAVLANCSVRTVHTAIKNFRNFGWLETTKRCYRSLKFHIHDFLLKINPRDPKLALKTSKSCESCEQGEGGVSRDKLHQELHHRECIPKDKNTLRYSVHHRSCFKNGKTINIRHNLRKYPFPAEEKIKIQRCFTEAEIACAAESYDSYKKTVQNPIRLFWWLCKQSKRIFTTGK